MIHPAHDTMRLLLDRAEDNLTNEDLKELAGLADTASEDALRLSQVITDVACLVTGDADAEAPNKVGSFQSPDSVFILLCHIASSLDTIAGMTAVSVEAQDMLTRRHRATT